MQSIQEDKDVMQCSSLNSTVAQEASPYRVPQTLGKAVKKSWNALPCSPRKQKVVVSNLAKKVGLKLQQEKEPSSSGHDIEKSDNELAELVAEFLCRTDIAYTALGMHDEITIWEDGEKKRVRKLYLTMYMKEADALFKDEHPNVKIGFSKFCSLRPKNVLLNTYTFEKVQND
ncbi:hypothetical protein JTE90_000001 [Oedothorax gibbosus]|uniref:Uncharacterized protein n=1 Tax=Oedothorax gibbosus TaxID=931172 RepID=A0AAV6TV43_9ARAC|nr:hypothetical protein JTE90_000001 [Oedothorax gibbosus]